MFLRRTGSSICRLFDPVKPVKPVALSDTTKGPVSPLERNPQSPKGWKNRESDGIGLGIVAALEKSGKIRYVSNPLGIQNHRDEVTCKSTFGRKKDSVFFCGSPPAREDTDLRSFRVADFLSCCYLCRKRLHGKDIYMYRGEKAFCSIECRYQQITSDEFHEKCGSEAMRTSDNAMRLSYTDERRIFFTGIAAA